MFITPNIFQILQSPSPPLTVLLRAGEIYKIFHPLTVQNEQLLLKFDFR